MIKALIRILSNQPHTRRRLTIRSTKPRRPIALLISLTLYVAYGASSITHALDRDSQTDWHTYGGDNANSHYAKLDQINSGNVSKLRVAWRYNSAKGEPLPASSELQVNPIVINGVLYGRNPNYNVFAVRADTGEELWTFKPAAEHVGLSNMRGVTYWEAPKNEPTDTRIFFATSHYMFALDASSGKPITSFGSSGVIDLRVGLRRDPSAISVNVPSPGVIYKNLIIVGSTVSETDGAAPGDIRAYDVISGELVWNFHTVPLPGEFGYDSWPPSAHGKVGGANAWAGMSIDAQRGVVYAPTGSPAPDFDGSDRIGANLFANSVLALDATSGERIWHYQTVHHDLWDRDLSAAPTLVTVRKDGATIDMLAQTSKQGVIYLLDRDTGEPIFPIEEVPVAPSTIPGESAYPTQPRVTLPEPFSRQAFTEDMITDINPTARAYVTQQYQQALPFSYFRPFGLQKTILYPGFYGGANWGGGAFDPDTNIFYINAMEAPALVNFEKVQIDKGTSLGFGKFVYQKYCAGCHGATMDGFYPYAPALHGVTDRVTKIDAMQVVSNGKGRMMPFSQLSRHERTAVIDYIFDADKQRNKQNSQSDKTAQRAGKANTEKLTHDDKNNDDAGEKESAYIFAGYTPFTDDRYYPAVKPPWGTLNAIDLASGKRLWQITLGEYQQLLDEGVPPTGTLNYGGPVVTKGGLLIIAATADEKLRIFDKRNGELLWQHQLPAAGYSTPSTYTINGKQYIVVVCSGGKLGTASGDEYLAFALGD